ncbi:MAG: CHAT domain-containing protein, partial [Gemmatimonadales bacterium]|nr:CHAT domain-containing protein [Gemmatimonadales bacterium]
MSVPATIVAQPGPARLVRELEVAVDRDRTDSARAAWRRILAQRPTDPTARFAVASLDRLEYRRASAEAGFRELARATRVPAEWRAAAHFALGRLRTVAGDTTGLAFLRSTIALADSAGTGSVGASARLELARMLSRAGRGDSAGRLVDRAVALVPATDTSLTAVATCAATSTVPATNPARADSLLARGRALAEAAGDHRATARCRISEYQVLIGRGRARQAGAALDSAMAAARRTRDSETKATAFQLRAFVYVQFSVGLANGRSLANQAIREARRSGNRLAEGYAHLNLAQLAIRVGDFGVAAAERDTAVAVLGAIGDRSGQAAAEFVGADAAFAIGDIATAARGYDRAFELYRALGAPIGGVLQRRALAAISRRDFDGARQLLTDATAEARRSANRGALLDLIYYDALLALTQNRHLEAASGFRRYREQLDPGAFQYRLDAGTREAEALALAGRLDQAAAVLDSALVAIEQSRRLLIQKSDTTNRDAIRSLAANRRFEFDPDLGLATIVAALATGGRTEAAFRFADAERARTLWVQLARRAAANDSARPNPTVLVPNALPIADLVAVLDSTTAILAYSTGAGGEPSTAFVLDRRGLKAFPVPPGDSLAGPIGRFTALARSGTWAVPLGRTLAERILDQPLRALDPAVRRLIVVPDGPLYRLPVDALPLPDRTPLLTRYEVTIAPSVRLAGEWLGRAVEPRRPAAPIVAFGDPRLDRRLGLRRLPG